MEVFWLQKKGLGLGCFFFVSPVSCPTGLFARPRAVLVIGSKSGQEEKKVCRVDVYACTLLAETSCSMFFTFTPFLIILHYMCFGRHLAPASAFACFHDFLCSLTESNGSEHLWFCAFDWDGDSSRGRLVFYLLAEILITHFL